LAVTWQEEFGLQIRDARKLAGMSQAQLATKMTVGRAQLSNYENGKSDIPAHVAVEIAEALGKDFVVRGCRIGRDRTDRPRLSSEPHQLSLELDIEHHYPESSVTIKPTRDSIVLTATMTRMRGA
jgi:transcriptional regulator with XRE-family HTH domain